MAEVTDTSFLSIGEVLGLLLEDFPDVTISKIRFLESQGLISPERTPSGYRKFYDPDVELLRVILTEQRSNYLPLRVIKDRLETGQIDPTGEHLRPNGADDVELDDVDEPVPRSSISSHPAARGSTPADPIEPSAAATPDAGPGSAGLITEPTESTAPANVAGGVLPGVLVDRDELCSMTAMTESELHELESFGVIAPREGSLPALYDDDAVHIAGPACALLRAGVDARHLRTWRTSAEREASLYEQLVTPRFRQRNPESRTEALDQLRKLDALGGKLRAALTHQVLRRHFEA